MRCSWFLQWLLIVVATIGTTCVYALGINWGKLISHKLPTATYVKMLKDNGFKKVKLYDQDEAIMKALAGTGIEVIVGIPNAELVGVAEYAAAEKWVEENVICYIHDKGVDIKYVAVGNEPFLRSYDNAFTDATIPALENIQKALDKAGVGDTVKATIPFYTDICELPRNQSYPSAARFRSDIRELMKKILDLLNQNGAPFVVDINPYFSIEGDNQREHRYPLEFAFFNGNAPPVDDKGTNISYSNAFDADFDGLVSALKAEGYGNMTIMVGAVGWPTDGSKEANIHNAQRFYSGLFAKLAFNAGTPLRPGYIEIYLLGLVDEDKRGVSHGNFERHWGLFRYDGRPKFALDMSGENQSKLLQGAQDVKYQEDRWCIVDPEVTNLSKVEAEVDYACSYGDCTALQDGGSCSFLKPRDRASYAFNTLYQLFNQTPNYCNFNGLATVTTRNHSQGNCNFIIQIVPSYAHGTSPSGLMFVTLMLIMFL